MWLESIFWHRDRIWLKRQMILRSAAPWCLAAALVAVAPATAATTEPKAADERTSVASHIPGPVSDVRPVHVITRQEIERSGMSTVQELVSSRSAYNNFGLYRPLLGGSIYLVDGRPTSSLDSVPIASVERIEFISDGAAALHAGGPISAINIVLRHGFEGATAWAGAERPARPGSEIGNAGGMWGGKVGRGRLTIGVDGFRRAEIRSKNRAHSRASWTDGGSFAGVSGVSVGGNTVFATDGKGTDTREDDVTVARPLGECSGGSYAGMLSNPNSQPGSGCGFAWADIAWIDNHRRLARYNLFADFDYPLGKGATLYTAARFSQGQTKFRYAPGVGPFSFDFTDSPNQDLLDFRARLLSSDLDLPSDFNVSNVTRVTLNHRFTAHGNREWRTDLLQYDVTAGLRGHLGAGIGYDMHANSRRVTALEHGVNFVSERLIKQAIVDGTYDLENPLNPHPDDPAAAAAHWQAVRDSTVRQKHTTSSTNRTARLAVNGPGNALPGGPLRWAAGLEVDYREERENRSFRSRSGTHDVSDVIGLGGSSYFGERLRWSMFGEVRLPMHRDWTVALGVRHDRYDDVGPTWSYQAASVWRLHKVLSLRGSWESGRSPASLSDLHSPASVYIPRICDRKTFAGALADCPRPQVEALTGGNPKLEPHNTQSYTFGAKSTLGKLSVSADWFRIERSETPDRLSAQKIVDIEASGGSLPPGTAVIREGSLIRRIVNPIVNSGESEVSGLDIRAGARWKFDELDSGFDLRWLHMLDYEARVGGIEQPGDFARNRIHATLSAGPGLQGSGWVVDWNIRAVSEYSNSDNSGRFETWIGHDIGLTWGDAFGLKGLMLRGGVFNLGDAGPATDTSNPGSTIDRYDAIRGRTFYLSVKATW